jgi:hypothetical protein
MNPQPYFAAIFKLPFLLLSDRFNFFLQTSNIIAPAFVYGSLILGAINTFF